MARLGDIAEKVRSKNAGPFWLTIDIFCADGAAFETICKGLDNQRFAAVFAANPDDIKRFEIADLNVLKLSLPRPQVQGSIGDRDIHGASWAALLGAVELG